MPNVMEVVNGLEMSYKYSNVDENNTLVPQWIVLHALALLKAEPRVMTLEEVLALPYDTPIYIENCDGLYGWDIFSGTVKDDDNDVVTGASWATAEYWPQDEYGDTWRCWTSRPTDEQRKAVKWE